MQRRLDRQLEAMTLRRSTIEHVFGTLKHWMGSTHFLTRALEHVDHRAFVASRPQTPMPAKKWHVGAEMSLHVLAYNLKRVMQVPGIAKTMKGAMKLAGA